MNTFMFKKFSIILGIEILQLEKKQINLDMIYNLNKLHWVCFISKTSLLRIPTSMKWTVTIT